MLEHFFSDVFQFLINILIGVPFQNITDACTAKPLVLAETSRWLQIHSETFVECPKHGSRSTTRSRALSMLVGILSSTHSIHSLQGL